MSDKKEETKHETLLLVASNKDVQKSKHVKHVVNFVQDIMAFWNDEDFRSLTKWYELMTDVVPYIERWYGSSLNGVQKAECATTAIVSVMKELVKEQSDNPLLHLIIDNPIILTASTGMAKKLYNHIDADGDGVITGQECRACCWPFGNKKKKKKKKALKRKNTVQFANI